jgi:hypothetical protein
MRRFLFLLFFSFYAFHSFAQQIYTLSGRITDTRNLPVAFTSVYIRNSTYGTTSNENGSYVFRLAPGTYHVIYRFVGYKEINDLITITDHNVQHNVVLVPDVYQLKQVSVKDSATLSATEIIKKVISKRLYYLNEINKYSCVVYIKGVQRLVSAPRMLMGRDVAKALELDSNRKGILYQSESLSTYSYQIPGKIKEEMIASKVAGQNTAFSYNKASDLTVNFYENTFVVSGLSSHGFVSPVADKALSYYRYRLLGTKTDNGVKVYKLQVIPKREYDPVFTGYIYIVDGDWRIYSADLYLTKRANDLNLVDTLEISQQYVPIKDNIWQPLSTQYSFRGKVLGFAFEGYYLAIYNNYNLNPTFPAGYFNGEIMHIDTQANKKDSAYWQNTRPVPLTAQENKDYIKKDAIERHKQTDKYLDSVQPIKNKINYLPYLVFGYSFTSRDNKDTLFLFPFTQTLFYNTVEGVGVNLRVRYKHIYDDFRSLTITPDVRYGVADKLFNANVRADYVYDPFHQGEFFGGFGSDILDLNNVGTRSLYFNTLSTLLSARNFVKYYRSQFGEFGYQRELTNGLLWTANLSYAKRTQLYNNSYYSFSTAYPLTSNNPLMPNAPATDRSTLFPQNNALTFSTSFTYTFDQQYITRPSGRIIEPSPYPEIAVNYRKGINGLGSNVDYDFGSLSVFQDHLPIGLAGFSSFKITVGDFFNNKKVYFMDYNHFLGNQGTTFDPDPGNFHFLPFYTYSTDGGFFEGHFEHNFAGSLLNEVRFLRALKLDEIVGVNYLSEKANANYSEFYIGVQRLIFRIDYGVAFEGNHKYMQGFRIFYGIK